MKIQDLAIIFIIIILPISLVIATYTQFQINTINTQSLYDSKLTSATYDAIRAFQINTTSSQTSELSNSKIRDIEASISAFRNSIKTAFSLSGYSDDAVDQYIPALVYTLYDGFYIYSPYENKVNQSGEIVNDSNKQYGLKPYISYSCRYVRSNIDVIITYALDNHISVQGIINGEYVNKEGYLIDNIVYNEGTGNVIYNGVAIEEEQVKQYLPLGQDDDNYKYIKLDGTTYYLDEKNSRIIARLNDTALTVQCSAEKNGVSEYNKWKNIIEKNCLAKDYYIDAYNFTNWLKSSGLQDLTYGDARDSIINSEGNVIENQQLCNNDNKTKKIFDFNASENDYSANIENELSNFNEHRLSIIRHKIEVNLAIAIANYNAYLGTNNVFQMPKLEEEEWYNLTHNISLMSFLQGFPIGTKEYNGYSLVTNSESKEVVLENNIYILGQDKDGNKQYYKIGDKEEIKILAGEYSGDGTSKSAGRINLDFNRNTLVNTDKTKTYYYYPIKDNDASYNSVIMQNNVDTYDDIYEYVNMQSTDLKKAFYTALGRERAGLSKVVSDYVSYGINIDNGNLEETVDPVLNWTVTYKYKTIGEISTIVKDGENFLVNKEVYNDDGVLCSGWSDGMTIYDLGTYIYDVSENIVLTAVFDTNYNVLRATKDETKATSGFLGNTNIQRQNIGNVTFVNGGLEKVQPKNSYSVSKNTGSGYSGSTKTWKDLSGSSNGKINGATWQGDCLKFDGVDDWVNLGQMSFDDKVMIEATISLDEIQPGIAHIVSNMQNGGVALYLGDGEPRFQVYIAETGEYIRAKSPTALKVGEKVNIRGMYDGKNAMVFVNGELVAKTSQEGTIGGPTNNTVMTIGTNPKGSAGDESFANINVYDVKIYDNVWDVSEAQNGSILAWNEIANSSGIQKVYIASEKEIYANQNSSYLFAFIGYSDKFLTEETITNINLLKTSGVNNMSYMFWYTGYHYMEKLNLGDNFNTSNVTNMCRMFGWTGYCSMENMNLGNNFDTSKVTNMEGMFYHTGYLKHLYLGPKFTKIAEKNNWMFTETGQNGINIYVSNEIYSDINNFKLNKNSDETLPFTRGTLHSNY